MTTSDGPGAGRRTEPASGRTAAAESPTRDGVTAAVPVSGDVEGAAPTTAPDGMTAPRDAAVPDRAAGPGRGPRGDRAAVPDQAAGTGHTTATGTTDAPTTTGKTTGRTTTGTAPGPTTTGRGGQGRAAARGADQIKRGPGARRPGGAAGARSGSGPLAGRASWSALRVELRRGIGPLAGVAVLAAVAVSLYTQSYAWRDTWPETAALVRANGLVTGGPLAAGAACWQGGRERRRGTVELLGSVPRGRLRLAALAAAPAVAWPVVGYLVVAVAGLLVTRPYASYGHPCWGLLAADVVAIGSLAVLGFVAGRAVPWRLAPPVVALLTVVAMGMPRDIGNAAQWLDPAGARGDPWTTSVWWYAPASVVWTAGLATAALLAHAARDARGRSVALLPLAAATTAAVLLVQAGSGVWRPDPAATALVCDHGRPQVCVTRAHSRLLPATSRALAGLDAELRVVRNAPSRFVEHDRRRAGDASLPGGLATYFHHDHVTDPVGLATNAAYSAASPSCPGISAAEQYTDVGEAVVEWLVPQPPGAIVGRPLPAVSRSLHRLRTMPRRARTAWLSRYFADVSACHPGRVTAP